MTFGQSVRAEFEEHLKELDCLFHLYGCGPELFIDTKFIQEQKEKSEFLQAIVELNRYL